MQLDEIDPPKFKETFTLTEVHEREKPLMLELNASHKEIERLKAKLSALHFTFNGIYNETLNPMGADTKKEEKKRLVAKADSYKNKEVMRELVYDKSTEEEVDRIQKLTFMEKLKSLFHIA